jgi:hypothetical protein
MSKAYDISPIDGRSRIHDPLGKFIGRLADGLKIADNCILGFIVFKKLLEGQLASI